LLIKNDTSKKLDLSIESLSNKKLVINHLGRLSFVAKNLTIPKAFIILLLPLAFAP